ncbi:MAG TPA: NADP-dependent malic enzyme [Longimicrobiales bacterium]|nr:NADP-dependent malic enzyme [Longimicrobiales bacterium]
MGSKRDEALEYHEKGRPGKIAVVPTKPVGTQRDLSLAYTPGVAEPCREIAANPDDVFRYTARGNLVAVVTNGTAVLGLGNLGPLGAKPVMEGKGVLFKRFADIDVFDIEVDSTDADEIIRFCEMLAPTVGGINLEDIAAPDCFYIEEQLKAKLDIPVFHDDQHGTAIISGAALVNACEVTNRKLSDVVVVFSGAGAAAIATAEHYVRLGVKRQHIYLCDSKGVVTVDRLGQVDQFKARFAQKTSKKTLADALVGADMFVGLSVAGIVNKAMIAKMAKNPIIFALANPDPEILPEEVAEVRSDAIMATGRTDYPNQVNNVLGFPFIFRGALDVRARSINEEMKMAATHALANLAKQDVPESVAHAYGETTFQFGPAYLIPKPFDPRVLLYVAPAVAKAAMETGVARTQIDLQAYRNKLEARLGRRREVMRDYILRAQANPKRIVFPEGENTAVLRAAVQSAEEGIAKPILLGRASKIRELAKTLHLDLRGVDVVEHWADEQRREHYAAKLFLSRQRKGMTLETARETVRSAAYFGCMMVREGDADGLVAGQEVSYSETIRPALEVVGTAPHVKHVAGLYMMILEHEIMFFADTTVNIDPDAETLAEIALLTAQFVRRIGIEPHMAMLSFSNFGSSRHHLSDKVAEAVRMVKAQEPELIVDGEMQADSAVLPEILTKTYPFSTLQERANVLIFPDLNSANIAYKLLWRIGGAEAIGPILLGMARPVHVLQRGSEAADIVNLTAIAVVDAQQRNRPEPSLANREAMTDSLRHESE